MVETVLAYIAAAGISVVSIAAVAWIIFQKLGEKWLDNKFSAQLEAARHAQQQELERLKFKINTLLDRATRLHTAEFAVLPQALKRLVNAYYTTRAFIFSCPEAYGLQRHGR